MKKVKVLNSLISVGSYQEFINEIFSHVQRKTPASVCFANVHMVMEGYNDSTFQKIINTSTIVAPDGKPISLFLTHLEDHKQERVCGMDLLPDLLKQAEALGKSVFFLGGTNELLGVIIQKANKEFPALKICGSYSPPFKQLSAEENDFTLQVIKDAVPDLVFVSLGCPKQEKWMAANKEAIGACLLGVGQAFTVYAGVEKRLPKWMRDLSLEWLYRLYLEPKRLWKRYLFTNSYFLLLTLFHSFNLLLRKSLAPLLKVKAAEGVLPSSEK